jgi:hypothetical protein
MLKENASLESLSILDWHETKAEDYVAFVTALQHNRTLKTLRFHSFTIRLTDDEDKHVVKIIKKNYALESLPEIDLENGAEDVGAILQLNAAGRQYLVENGSSISEVEDGSSISEGVNVLSHVSNDINCVLLHLLENPRLCDRSTVE